METLYWSIFQNSKNFDNECIVGTCISTLSYFAKNSCPLFRFIIIYNIDLRFCCIFTISMTSWPLVSISRITFDLAVAQCAVHSCEICDNKPGSQYCTNCEQYFCSNCKLSHLKAKISKYVDRQQDICAA
jgi:hypothetical protein